MKAFITGCVVAIATFHASAQDTPPGSVLASSSGRFVFGQISMMARDQYMLDTQTGRLWQLMVTTPKKANGTPDKEKAYTALEPVPYSELDGRLVFQPAPTK